jgi:hypothetical protein
MHSDLAHARTAIRATTGALTVEQIAREVPGRWSIGQILEHLTLGFEVNTAALEKAVVSGSTRAKAPTLMQRLFRLVVIDFGYFPRADAPEYARPSGSVDVERIREAIDAALVRLDATLDRAAERFGEGTPLLKHPYFAAMTVRQWRRFHRRHTVHHLRQVRARARAAGA